MKHLSVLAVSISAGLCILAASACGSDDGGSGGSGGSSAGSGGASGSAGSGGGQTGGTSGAGGGSGGSAGSAGTGTGGSGGSGGTGSDPCKACIQSSCGSAWSACEPNADCAAIYQCFAEQNCEAVPEPRQCADDCGAQNPGGTTLFDAVFTCADTNCVTACGG